MTNIRLKILESNSDIKYNILSSLSVEVSKLFKRAEPTILTKCKQTLLDNIKNQPEYFSLTSSNGSLRLEFGIPDTSIVDNIILELIDNTTIISSPIKIGSRGLNGNITIRMVSNDKIKELCETVFVRTEKSEELPWLSWLLQSGTAPIVKGYSVSYRQSVFSRTGGALMVESKKNWRVPPEFAGTITNNWFTRSTESLENQIIENIKQSILENL